MGVGKGVWASVLVVLPHHEAPGSVSSLGRAAPEKDPVSAPTSRPSPQLGCRVEF